MREHGGESEIWCKPADRLPRLAWVDISDTLHTTHSVTLVGLGGVGGMPMAMVGISLIVSISMLPTSMLGLGLGLG